MWTEDAAPDRRIGELRADVLETVTTFIQRHPEAGWDVLVAGLEEALSCVRDAAGDDERIRLGDRLELTALGRAALAAWPA